MHIFLIAPFFDRHFIVIDRDWYKIFAYGVKFLLHKIENANFIVRKNTAIEYNSDTKSK